MDDDQFPRLVSLACHDLRTPLATAYGFARTLTRGGTLDEQSARWVEMIEAASQQMTGLLDQLAVAARIAGERYDPAPREADTLELARAAAEEAEHGEVAVTGTGTALTLDLDATRVALRSLAECLLRHGAQERIDVEVSGAELTLAPVADAAAPIVLGEELRDLGAAVAVRVVRAQGGDVVVDGGRLRVTLGE